MATEKFKITYMALGIFLFVLFQTHKKFVKFASGIRELLREFQPTLFGCIQPQDFMLLQKPKPLEPIQKALSGRMHCSRVHLGEQKGRRGMQSPLSHVSGFLVWFAGNETCQR